MSRMTALLEERKKVWDRMQEIREQAATNENGEFSAEQRTNWDAAAAQVATLSGDIEREKTNDSIQRDMDALLPSITQTDVEPGSGVEDTRDDTEVKYAKAFDLYTRSGPAALNGEQRTMLESRALAVGTSSAGGYTVPPGFRDVLIETLKWYGAVRQVATIVESSSGQPLQWPTFNGTAQVGRILAENSQLTETDPAFGTATLGAYMYSSDSVLVPYQFLQDTAIDVEAFIARILGTRIGRIQNTHFTTGTGSSQPLGIQTNATTGATLATGNVATITYAGLLSLIHSVDIAYRNGGNVQGDAGGRGNAKFMMSDTALAAMQAIVDSQNRPLWQPSLQVGAPDMFLGYPYVINNDMPVPAASVKSVLFGDFERGYVIRDVVGFQVRRLDERYADFLQVGWFGFARSDATVQDAAAYKALAQSAT
jgi:HK97 family phage major capsid protein